MKYFVLIIGLSKVFSASLVFVDLQDLTPIAQARLFHKETPIYLITKTPREVPGVQVVPYESLPKSSLHEKYLKKAERRPLFSSIERLFILSDFMKEYKIEDLFYIDNQTMLYTELEPFAKQKILAALGFDKTRSPPIIYISTSKPIDKLVKFVLSTHETTMGEYLYKFGKKFGCTWLDAFPENGSLFDTAAFGKHLTGSFSLPYTFFWEKDAQNRLVPYILRDGTKFPVNNLCIPNDNLKPFLSLQ